MCLRSGRALACLALLAFATLSGCAYRREPIVVIEPSYSHVRTQMVSPTTQAMLSAAPAEPGAAY